MISAIFEVLFYATDIFFWQNVSPEITREIKHLYFI